MVSYLLVFYSNFVPKSTVFEIFDLYAYIDHETRVRVTPGHQNGHLRSATCDFRLTFYGNYGPMSYRL